MPTFILLTRLSLQALHQPKSFETLERHVSQQVLNHCPTLKWVSSHALLGPWDCRASRWSPSSRPTRR